MLCHITFEVSQFYAIILIYFLIKFKFYSIFKHSIRILADKFSLSARLYSSLYKYNQIIKFHI